jgi:hypothetical protein
MKIIQICLKIKTNIGNDNKTGPGFYKIVLPWIRIIFHSNQEFPSIFVRKKTYLFNQLVLFIWVNLRKTFYTVKTIRLLLF